MRIPSYRFAVTSLISAFLLAFLLLAVLLPGPSRVRAQDETPYTVFHNMETFERDGERVQALRIPVYVTLKSWAVRRPGLRLRLAGSFAAADLAELVEQDLRDVRVLSIVPGLELVLPLAEYRLLRPFLDFGVGTNDITDEANLLASMGLRADLIFPRGDFLFGLEPGFQLNANTGVREAATFNPFLTITTRRVLGGRIAGRLPDLGAYFEAGYNFQEFELTSIRASSDRIRTNLEVGFGFGFSHGRPRIGPFPVPRLRVGYRFGDVEGFRIRIGGDWLVTIPEGQDSGNREE